MIDNTERRLIKPDDCRIIFNDRPSIKALVEQYHYSHRMPTSIFTATWLWATNGDVPIAGCSFGVPTTKWSEEVVELNRLVVRQGHQVFLTKLISLTIREMVKYKKEVDLLISYADWTQKHHGGIYQAASWNFHGKRQKTNDGLLINGTFIPGRTCNSRYGTRSAKKLQEMYPHWNIENHYDDGKCLFWKALNRKGEKKATRLGLQKNNYIKNYEKEIE